MATGKSTEARGHVVGFREEIDKVAGHSDDEFFTWFDSARDKHAAFVRGMWDFMVHIALPCSPYLTTPEDKTALEIGHGGGRVLAAASRSFKRVVGIDIHDHNERVKGELKAIGVDSFLLVQTDGSGSIPVEDCSIDCVYSFIVLQHVETMSVFRNYLAESFRILKGGGIGVLYFGRQCTFSSNRSWRVLYWADRLVECVLLQGGFKELPARVNCTNLVVSLPHAKRLARSAGFEVLSELVSRRRVPDGVRLYGGQNGLVIRKAKLGM